MIFAGQAVEAGYQIAYAADAQVIHSHNYTAMQQLHRNFDLGVSQADHPEVFGRLHSEGEGIRLVKKTAKWLVEKWSCASSAAACDGERKQICRVLAGKAL